MKQNKIGIPETLIERLLFEQTEKPDKHSGTKVINVYDNRYRINVYHEIFDKELNLYKRRMFSSFFAVYNDDDDKLKILYPKTRLDK